MISQPRQGPIERVLASCAGFSALSPDAIASLAAAGRPLVVEPGELVVRDGDPGDAAYVVLSGRVEAVATVEGTEHVVVSFGRGQVVGELSLLAGTRRSGSVRAVRQSELLRLEAADVLELIEREPGFAVAVARSLAQRLQRSGPALVDDPPAIRTVALVRLDAGLDARLRPEALAEELGRHGPVRLVTAPEGAEEAVDSPSEVVVLVADAAGDPEWTAFCVRHADALLAVAAPGTSLPPAEMRRVLAGCHLVLLGAPEEWGDIAAWLDALDASAHQFVDGSTGSVAGLARRVTRRSLGLVLSGGGARAFAHIGVLAALRDRGLVFDRVGGTSMGAFVAALAALGATPEEMIDLCREELVRGRPFADYTLPRVALIRGRRARAMLHRVFGERRLEALPLDLFCVSADLVAAEVVVHRRGPLERAVGASMALPGLAPPMADRSRLLVDGGVLDTLPVDVMAARPEGPIVAVDVGRPLRRARDEEPLPRLLETLMRSTTLGSWGLAARNAMQASLVVAPEVDDVGLLEWHRLDEIVELGRAAAIRALDANPTPLEV